MTVVRVAGKLPPAEDRYRRDQQYGGSQRDTQEKLLHVPISLTTLRHRVYHNGFAALNHLERAFDGRTESLGLSIGPSLTCRRPSP